jgi:hypothetical protein
LTLIVGELFWDVGVELLVEYSLAAEQKRIGAHARARARPTTTRWRVFLSVLSYGLLGALLGGLSLAIWPNRMTGQPWVRVATVLAAAMVGGAVMERIGARRDTRDEPRVRLASVGTGAFFALMFSAARALGHAWLN